MVVITNRHLSFMLANDTKLHFLAAWKNSTCLTSILLQEAFIGICRQRTQKGMIHTVGGDSTKFGYIYPKRSGPML